jgi:hypothetical protein
MRDLEFTAAVISAAVENGTCIVGLADRKIEPEHCIVLQRSLSPDEQDIALGQDTYYIEVCGEEMSGYGGIERATLGTDVLDLKMRAANNVLIGHIVARFHLSHGEWRRLAESLGLMFANTGTELRLES